MNAAMEARLESDVNWAGDWFADWKCLKIEAGRKAGGTDEQWGKVTANKSVQG